MEHSYIINPFADVICTICQYVVKVKSTTLYVALNRHERQNANHPTPHGEDERKAIVTQLQHQIKEVSLSLWNLCINDTALANEFLLQYLSLPPEQYMFCNICEVLVKDRHHHKRGQHSTSCLEVKMGYKILNWEKKDPNIVPFPINIDDQSIFGDMFRVEWCAIINAQKNDEHISTIDSTVQQITEDDNIADTAEQIALDAILIEQNQRFQDDPINQIIPIHDHYAEPNLWLIRAGYDQHLQELNMVDLFNVASLDLQENEVDISRIWSRIKTITDNAIVYSKSIDRSNLVLMEVKRIDIRPSNKPFNPSLKLETWDKYIRMLKKVITVIFRLETGNQSRKRYKLTTEQHTHFQSAMDDRGNRQMDRFYLDLLFSFLRQRIIENSYECVLLSAIAVMSIKRDATFLQANEVTPIYAGLIALFRALILFAARNFPMNNGGLLENTRMFTDEMMIHPDLSRSPGAMAWIFNTFSYAKVISQNSIQPGNCYWDNDALVYRGVTRFTMAQF